MGTAQFWQQTGLGLVELVGQIAVIVIPLMIFMEIMKDLNILDRISGKLIGR